MQKLLAVFQALLESKTVEQVDDLLNDHDVDKRFRFSEETYPRINFKISPEEIAELKRRRLLGEDNTIHDVTGFSTMEKLLYALVWKNGDLKKIKHIVGGILATDDESVEQAIVFNQYGKYLSGKHDEPIIDQHVLRAFSVYEHRENEKATEQYKKLEIVTKKDAGLVKRYKTWLRDDLAFELRQIPEYTYHVDKVLFALGKYIKYQ